MAFGFTLRNRFNETTVNETNPIMTLVEELSLSQISSRGGFYRYRTPVVSHFGDSVIGVHCPNGYAFIRPDSSGRYILHLDRSLASANAKVGVFRRSSHSSVGPGIGSTGLRVHSETGQMLFDSRRKNVIDGAIVNLYPNRSSVSFGYQSVRLWDSQATSKNREFFIASGLFRRTIVENGNSTTTNQKYLFGVASSTLQGVPRLNPVLLDDNNNQHITAIQSGISNSGRYLCVGNYEVNLAMWDLIEGEKLYSINAERVFSVRFTPSETRVVLRARNYNNETGFIVLDVQTGVVIRQVYGPTVRAVETGEYNGVEYILVGYNGWLRVYLAATGAYVRGIALSYDVVIDDQSFAVVDKHVITKLRVNPNNSDDPVYRILTIDYINNMQALTSQLRDGWVNLDAIRQPNGFYLLVVGLFEFIDGGASRYYHVVFQGVTPMLWRRRSGEGDYSYEATDYEVRLNADGSKVEDGAIIAQVRDTDTYAVVPWVGTGSASGFQVPLTQEQPVGEMYVLMQSELAAYGTDESSPTYWFRQNEYQCCIRTYENGLDRRLYGKFVYLQTNSESFFNESDVDQAVSQLPVVIVG